MDQKDSGKQKPVFYKKGTEPEVRNVEVAPGVLIREELKDSWPKVESTGRECINITATPAAALEPQASKFGGQPYLPKDFIYPKDGQGNDLFHLLQINCSELPENILFPASGFIQCYISPSDGFYGMDPDDPENRKNFRVLYFKPEQLKQPMTDFSFLPDPASLDVPVTEPYRLAFSTGVDYMGIGDVAYGDDPERMELAARFPEKAEPGVLSMDTFVCCGHKMGGYNGFCQYDLRATKPEYHNHIALFQIDSADGVMWGDMGLGHFFIHPDDLAKKDFSKVLYYWDAF